MNFKLISEPAVEPLELSQIKTYHRISGTDQDDVIASLMVAARQVVESHTGRSLITQTWEGVADAWRVPLALKPSLQTVQSVEYYDLSGDLQTLSSDEYRVFSYGLVGEIHPVDRVSWPMVQTRPDAIKVTFKAGYGDEASDVPKAIWQAMMLLFGHFFENRESTSPIIIRDLPMFGGRDTVTALLAPYTVPVAR